jgi:hypothetical protein
VGIDDIELDDTIDRNDFTVEQAAEVFKKASKAVKGGDAKLVKDLMDAGFNILKLVATLA